MDRDEAIARLNVLVGQDLRPLAEDLGVTVWNRGKLNKGWAGHTVERFLGLPLNSAQSPNLGTWELKVVPVKVDGNDSYRVKETVAITMIDPVEVSKTGFEDSHLFTKLRKIIAVSRTREDDAESSSICVSVHAFQLEGTELYQAVVQDYELVRSTIKSQGFNALTGRLGQYIQPRTKGAGKGSTSRAFYARKNLVEFMVGLKSSPQLEARFRVVDCSQHAGQENAPNRLPLDWVMQAMPSNQSGAGRHKCPYCAYNKGYSDALAAMSGAAR